MSLNLKKILVWRAWLAKINSLHQLHYRVNLLETLKIALIRWLEKDIWMLQPDIWKAVELKGQSVKNLLHLKTKKKDLFLNLDQTYQDQKLKKNPKQNHSLNQKSRTSQNQDLLCVNPYHLQSKKFQLLVPNQGKIIFWTKREEAHRKMLWIWQGKHIWIQQQNTWRLMVNKVLVQVDTLLEEDKLLIKRGNYHSTVAIAIYIRRSLFSLQFWYRIGDPSAVEKMKELRYLQTVKINAAGNCIRKS